MSNALAYLNGQFIPADSVSISPSDPGFLWGATVSDRARTYNGELFRLKDHLQRFRRSAESCRIPLDATDDRLAEIARHLIAHNRPLLTDSAELVVVMFATPQTLCLHTESPILEKYQRIVREGAKLFVPPIRHIPTEHLPRQAKMRSRMHWWIAEQWVHRHDPDGSALLFNDNGCITETASSNVLVVQQGTVCSPPRSEILHGVSLQVVEELCGELGIPFIEKDLGPVDCYEADEMLLTSTPYGVAGVAELAETPLTFPGPMLLRLHGAFSRRVGADIWAGLSR